MSENIIITRRPFTRSEEFPVDVYQMCEPDSTPVCLQTEVRRLMVQVAEMAKHIAQRDRDIAELSRRLAWLLERF